MDLVADKTGLRRNITISELNKARNTGETDYASSTIIDVSGDFSEIHPKDHQTIASKNLSRAIENLCQ